jgi:hypothetical protein
MKNKETLEEAAEKYHNKISKKRNTQLGVPFEDFTKGAKWQQERMYSEEEVHKIIESYQNMMENNPIHTHYDIWFEQFKKK